MLSSILQLRIAPVLIALMACGALCMASEPPQDSKPQEEQVPDIFIHYVLYLDAPVDAEALFAKHNQGKLKLLESPEQGTDSPGVLLRIETIEERPLPPMEALQYFSRGFNDKIAQEFLKSKSTISVIGLGPFDPKHELLKNLTLTVGKMANETDAFVSDVADSLTFTQESFESIRVAEIKTGQLSSNQFGVRAYRVDQGLRTVTMGLEKFGQTNLAIPNFSEHHMGVIDSFSGILIQSVIESETKVEPGELRLDPQNFANESQRERFESLLRPEFSGIDVELAEIEPQGGDPQELLGIVFENEPGEKLWQEQDQFLLTIFEKTRQISKNVDISSVESAIEAARTRATELLQDQTQWEAPRRLRVAISLPQKEVVWVEVRSFEEGAGKGIMLSQPTTDRSVKSGSEITFEAEMILDFVLSDTENTIEKGGVDELIQKLNSR